ncbi:alpha/beta hydrolase [Crocinitomix catalasitica]|uniref:alpha/beta hydrolase n=1 Tax=Crocinitomix catalasitica TaxID=184607 RepID=UPI0004893C96|nr:alpha/beta fold hydrolase [Crocinitomix catalasitica]
MEHKIEQINYQTEGRYTTFGNPEKADTLIIALHGYGQLATYFIRKFYTLNPDKYFIICPEAPHRFYLKASSGRVGASWMTKEDRLVDIRHYITYLNALGDDINRKYTFDQYILIGFSQGGATASRWLANTAIKFDTFILWAAVFPPDLEDHQHAKFKSNQNYFVYGDDDIYITDEQALLQKNKLKEIGLNFELIKFSGKHDIDSETLISIIS